MTLATERKVANTPPRVIIGAIYRLICAPCLFRGNRTNRLLLTLARFIPIRG